MGKVIDLTKLDGAHSLGEEFDSFVLGDEIKEALEKLLEAVRQGEYLSGKEGYTANNIFIDGRRGSGKTTVLLTLKEILEKELYKKEINKSWIPEGLERYSFKTVDSVVDTSVNTASITFYFLGWLKEQIEKNYESDFKLNEQLHRTIKLFPDYLKSCEKTCLDMSVDGDVEERLEQSDLNFRKELFKLIDLFLEKESCEKKSFIVLFMDDLDISFPPERIQKILTEVFMFLSHPNLVIIGSGNYENLLKIITCKVSENISNEYERRCLSEYKVRNIAKSILEKTFATHSIHLSSLSYEDIVTFQIQLEKEQKISIRKFMETIFIVKLLSFDSTIFRVLLNEITLRELILILKRVNQVRKRIENKTWKELPVLDLCFSHIYQEVKDLQVNITFDSRVHCAPTSREKASEFVFLAKRIVEGLEDIKKGEGVFFDYKEHSVLTTTLSIKHKTKIIALFWLWLNEHLLFMDGLIKNIPRLIILELMLSGNSNFSEFVEFWKNLDFSIKDLVEICSFYDKKIKAEREAYLAIQISSEIYELLGDAFVVKKGDSLYLHLLKILDFISSLDVNLSEHINDNTLFNQYQVVLFMDNLKDKILNNLGKSEVGNFALFLVIYFNLIVKLISFVKHGEDFDKGIYLQNYYNLVETLPSLRDVKIKIIEELTEEIESTYTALINELMWWLLRKGVDVTPGTFFHHISKLKGLFEQLNIEDILESRIITREYESLLALIENDFQVALIEKNEDLVKEILTNIRRHVLNIRRYLISRRKNIINSITERILESKLKEGV